MSCRRCGCESPRVKMVDDRCVSTAQCTKRLRARGEDGRVRVRVMLENPPVHKPTVLSVAKELRNAYYRYGLCVDCGVVRHSAGRIRCDPCHKKTAPRC
jgi:hypothetical protein